jgi:hypothetical protein
MELDTAHVMCERICQVQDPLNAVIAVLMNPVESLTTDEWEVLQEIAVLLKPFDAVTTEISAENSVTMSKIILLSRGLTSLSRSSTDTKK